MAPKEDPLSMPEASQPKQKSKVLVCLSSSPSSRRVLESASRFAKAKGSAFLALYVGDEKKGNDGRLMQNMLHAKRLGATLTVKQGSDLTGVIEEFARSANVTDLFIGYSGPSKDLMMHHLPAYRLVHELPEIQVHMIPHLSPAHRSFGFLRLAGGRQVALDISIMSAIMAVATLLSVLIDHSPYSNSNIVTIYILAVLVTAVMTEGKIYSILAAVLYILLFNFLFIEPRFSLLVYDSKYFVTYLVSLIAAVLTGNISSRMKESTRQAENNVYQAQILLNTSEQLGRAEGSEEIALVTTMQLGELLGREISYYPASSLPREDMGEEEKEAIGVLLRTGGRVGWNTSRYSSLPFQYLSVGCDEEMFGVLCVSKTGGVLNRFEENILLSLLGECALSLEAEKNRKEREKAQIVAENERFRSKLLRSISHDLRTPLTSISGNAANLLSHAKSFQESELMHIYSDIYEDSIWLIDLVENLLAITRLEESVEIHPTWEVVSDVLETAVGAARRRKNPQSLRFIPDEECLVAQMDVPLLLQVMANLLSNAAVHAGEGTHVTVQDWREGDKVYVSVTDDGPGIPPEEKDKIFDLFYSGKAGEADSSRSLGLGLNLCRSILDAHGESIWVEDNHPHGCIFTFSLKLWEGEKHANL